MSDTLPIFSSHYGMSFGSILTLEEGGKTTPGNPASIVDIARANHLPQVILIDEKIDGFIEAHKNLSKPFKPARPKALSDYLRECQVDKKAPSDEDQIRAQRLFDEATAKLARESKWSTAPIQLIFGLKLCVCADMTDKTEASLKTESNVIVFVKNSAGYSDLIRIQSRAWTDGFYYQGRTDWRALKALWTNNLSLVLPAFSSCIQRNTLTMSNIVPDFPVPPVLFKEMDSGLPFAPILDRAIDQFGAANSLTIQPVKSVYYTGPEDFDAYTTFRAIGNRSEFGRPNVDHMCSDRFSFADYLRLAAQA